MTDFEKINLCYKLRTSCRKDDDLTGMAFLWSCWKMKGSRIGFPNCDMKAKVECRKGY